MARAVQSIPLARPAGLIRPEEPMLLRRISGWRAVVDVVLGALIFLLAQMVIGSAGMTPDGELRWPGGASYLLLTSVPGLLTLLMIVGMVLFYDGNPAELGLRFRLFWLIAPISLLATEVAFVVAVMITISVAYFTGGFELVQENAENVGEMIPPWSKWAIGLWMLTVAFYEEAIFRGFLLPRLRRVFSSWPVAILLSSAIFAMLHLGDQNHLAATVLFFVASVWAITTILCRSIWPAVLSHFLFNMVQVLQLP